MRFLFYLGHPAHFHLFRNMIKLLKNRGHEVMVLIKKKDVLEDLVKATGWPYTNINPRGRKNNLLSIGFQVVKRDIRMLGICRRFRPHKLFGTSAEITHVGRLLGITSVVLNEDDSHAIPLFANLAFPFADIILCPDCVNLGRWEKRKTGYKGYQELAYLHPDYFTPDHEISRKLGAGKPYFILRFSGLDAHHDFGFKGITDARATELISILEPHGQVHITSERPVAGNLEHYRIRIDPTDMHSALAGAAMYIGDSQTMTAEAAVLGTPALRYNDFAGKLGYLRELEEQYKLTASFPTTDFEGLKSRATEWLQQENIKSQWQEKRVKMLNECIDLTKYLVNLAERDA